MKSELQDLQNGKMAAGSVPQPPEQTFVMNCTERLRWRMWWIQDRYSDSQGNVKKRKSTRLLCAIDNMVYMASMLTSRPLDWLIGEKKIMKDIESSLFVD